MLEWWMCHQYSCVCAYACFCGFLGFFFFHPIAKCITAICNHTWVDNSWAHFSKLCAVHVDALGKNLLSVHWLSVMSTSLDFPFLVLAMQTLQEHILLVMYQHNRKQLWLYTSLLCIKIEKPKYTTSQWFGEPTWNLTRKIWIPTLQIKHFLCLI